MTHLVFQVEVRMLIRAQDTTDSIKVWFIFRTVTQAIIFFNVLVINVHPFILWSALKDKFWSFLRVSLDVALSVSTAMKILVKILAIVAFCTLLFVIVKVLIIAALNAFFSG